MSQYPASARRGTFPSDNHYHITSPLPPHHHPTAALPSNKTLTLNGTHSRSHDQFKASNISPPVNGNPSTPADDASGTVHLHDRWYTLTDSTAQSSHSSTATANRRIVSLVNSHARKRRNISSLKRYRSLGTITGEVEFGPPQQDSVTPGPTLSIHGTGSISHIPSGSKLGRSLERMPGTGRDLHVSQAFASSEDNLKQIHEVTDKKLIHGPNGAYSQESYPISGIEGDREHLLQFSSPDTDLIQSVPENTNQLVQHVIPEIRSSGCDESRTCPKGAGKRLKDIHGCFVEIEILPEVSIVDVHTNSKLTSPSSVGKLSSAVSQQVREDCESNVALSPDLSMSGSNPGVSGEELSGGISDRLPGDSECITHSMSPPLCETGGKQSRNGHSGTTSGDSNLNRSAVSPLFPGLLDLNVFPRALDSDLDLSGEILTRSEEVEYLAGRDHESVSDALKNVRNSAVTCAVVSKNATPLLMDATSSNNLVSHVSEVNQEQSSSNPSSLSSTSELRHDQQSVAELRICGSQRLPVTSPIKDAAPSGKDSSVAATLSVIYEPPSSEQKQKDRLSVNSKHPAMPHTDLDEVSHNIETNKEPMPTRSNREESVVEGDVQIEEFSLQGNDLSPADFPDANTSPLEEENIVHDMIPVVELPELDLKTTPASRTGANISYENVSTDFSGLSSNRSVRKKSELDSEGHPITDNLQSERYDHPEHKKCNSLNRGNATSKHTSQSSHSNRPLRRPMSPLASARSAVSDHNISMSSTLSQTSSHGRGRDREQRMQGRRQGNGPAGRDQIGPVFQGRDQVGHPLQLEGGGNKEHLPHQGRGNKCEYRKQTVGTNASEKNTAGAAGGEQQPPAQNGDNSNSSLMRYSKQRQDSSRLKNRIKQDLDAMNSAISNMDSQASFIHPVRVQDGVAGGFRRGGGFKHRSEQSSQQKHHHNSTPQNHQQGTRPQQAQQHKSQMQQVSVQNHHSMTSQANGSTNPNDLSLPSHSSSAASKTITTAGKTHSNYRPISPARMAGYRLSSPRRSGEESSPIHHAPSNTQFQRRAAINREQQHHPRTTKHNSRSAVHHETATKLVPPPPQVTADSYDYLPPYSPPKMMPAPNVPTQAVQYQQPVGQQNQNEAGLPGASYPEPPPSYSEIFGQNESSIPSNSNQRNRESRNTFEIGGAREPSRRSFRLRNRGRIGSSDTNSHSTNPNVRQSGVGKLTSFTNLFRRTPRSQPEEAEHPAVGMEDYIAQWVASYNRTPRPHTSQGSPSTDSMNRVDASNVTAATTTATTHQREQTSCGFFQRSSSAGTRAGYGTTNCPIPYVHPPPFPIVDNTHQTDSRSTSRDSMISGGLRNLNLSLTHLPTTDDSSRNQMTLEFESRVSRLPRNRARPTSAYLPSDSAVFQLPNPSTAATPTQVDRPHQHAHLAAGNIRNTAVMTSCNDIPSEENARKPSSSRLRRRESEKINRHRRFTDQRHMQRTQVPDGMPTPTIPVSTVPNRQLEPESLHVPRGLAASTNRGPRNAVLSPALPMVGDTVDDTPGVLRGRSSEALQESNVVSPIIPGGSTKISGNAHSSTNSFLENDITRETTRDVGTGELGQLFNSSTNISAVSTASQAGREVRGMTDPSPSEEAAVSSPLHSSSNSVDTVSIVNSHSSRSAIRLRAEARRSSLLNSTSSDEDVMNELSQNTASTQQGRHRPRQKRSQCSNSFMSGSHQSQELHLPGDRHAEMRVMVRDEVDRGQSSGQKSTEDISK